MSLVIAIDFDGTIVKHRYPEIGPPVPGAIKWIKRFAAEGAKLILYTMRSDGRPDHGDVLTDAVEFCRSHGIEFFGVNDNPEQGCWTNSRKVYAHVYIDDAAYGCPLIHPPDELRPYVDWSKVGRYVWNQIVSVEEAPA